MGLVVQDSPAPLVSSKRRGGVGRGGGEVGVGTEDPPVRVSQEDGRFTGYPKEGSQ